jgi:cytochrome c6
MLLFSASERNNEIMKLSIIRIKRLITALAIPVIALVIWSSGASPANSAPFDPAADYKAKCASCHAADGSGNTPLGKKLQLKDLRSPEVQKMSDAQMNTLITKGKGKMPGYEKQLSADQIKQQVAYMRELAKKK